MAWVLEDGTAQKPETISVESNDQTGEKRSIFRYAVAGGWLYQFVNERRTERFESIAFVPITIKEHEARLKK